MCELLAPAGDFTCLKSAINAGADAIYVGGSRFSARAYAGNFSDEELVAAIRYSHLFGRKLYLTVNILLKNNELNELQDYIRPLYEAGLDGVIIQDIGVIDYLRSNFPGLELHGSTQMAITSELGARFAKSLGISRVVPARELSLQEMIDIKAGSGLEIECFIHGAMCYCYSGMCLFSSMLGDRSGNRGRCAQPCRLPYSPKIDGKKNRECYPLSLKDMCTLEHINELIEAGVDSFKIEGRMKSPEYVAGVTSIYRKYIDLAISGKTFRVDPQDVRQLDSLYIRSERMDGYYFRRNGKEMITLDSPAYTATDDRLIEKIRRQYVDTNIKLPLKADASFVVGEKAILNLRFGEIEACVEGEEVSESVNRPITKDDIIKQIGKLGDTVFSLEGIDVTASSNAFYRLKGINELRREAIAKLELMILKSNGYDCVRIPSELSENYESKLDIDKRLPAYSYVVNCRTADQIREIISLPTRALEKVSFVYVDGDTLLGDRDLVTVIEELSLKSEDVSILVSLPYIIRTSDYDFLERIGAAYINNHYIKGFFVRNYQEYQWVLENYPNAIIHCDHYLYSFNFQSCGLLSHNADAITIPLELTSEEQYQLIESVDSDNFIKIVYGYTPMMITANCIRKTISGCVAGKGGRDVQLNDRKNMELNVEIQCDHCYNVIYNSIPLLLIDKNDKIAKRVVRRIDFYNEGLDLVKTILELFLLDKRNVLIPEHTTGHERRPVL